MKQSSRTQNTLRNILFSILSLLLPVVLLLAQRAVFVRVLPVEYLGVNNLFADIFAMLALFEMGAGGAITYFFYQPLARGDYGKVRSLTWLYRTIYHTIGAFVVLVGLALTPFLPYLVKGRNLVPDFQLIYWLQLFTTAFTYFSGHQRSLFVADQKGYRMSQNDMVFRLIKTALTTIYLWFFQDFSGFMALGMVVVFIQNFVIVRMGKKHYPYAQGRAYPIPKEERKYIFSRVRAFMLHKIGGAVYNGTDNIMISKLVGLSALGLYSNYEAIKNFILLFQSQFFTAAIPSIGSIEENKSEERLHTLFKRVFYLNYLIAFFASACLYYLATPFLQIWIGKVFTLDAEVVSWIAITIYLSGIRHTALSFTNARGIFYQTRMKPLLEAGFNILFSFILGRRYGVAGVMMGSAIGLAVNMWIDPYYLFKLSFKQPVLPFFLENLKLVFWSLLVVGGGQFLIELLKINQLHFLIFSALVIPYILLMGIIPVLLSEELPYYRSLVLRLMSRLRRPTSG